MAEFIKNDPHTKRLILNLNCKNENYPIQCRNDFLMAYVFTFMKISKSTSYYNKFLFNTGEISSKTG